MARIQNLFLKQKGFVLDIPDWSFPDEGITALWGASGSGKTTLLHCIAGIHRPSHLQFELRGHDLAPLSLKERRVGLVFQNHLLFEHLTVAENILFPVKAQKIPSSRWNETHQMLVEGLGLSNLLHKKSTEISGGEKQRVGLARALMSSPQIMLLDEPMSSLDESLRDSAREMIRKLSIQFKIPFLIVTHDFADVHRLAQNLAILSHGKLIASGNARSIIDAPPTLEAAQLLPSHQILHLGSEKWVFKPWHVQVNDRGPYQAVVLQVLDDGPGVKALLRLPDGQTIWAWDQKRATFSTKDLKFDLLADGPKKFKA